MCNKYHYLTCMQSYQTAISSIYQQCQYEEDIPDATQGKAHYVGYRHFIKHVLQKSSYLIKCLAADLPYSKISQISAISHMLV